MLAGRPAVAVIVPFAGSHADAEAMLAALRRLELGPADELVVVDNGAEPVAAAIDHGAGVAVIGDGALASSYYARNAGVRSTGSPWLLFLDSDCVPAPGLIDAYFAPPPRQGTGVVAGAVVAAEQESFAARYAASRRQIEVGHHLTTGPLPAGVTANLLLSRECWVSLGGFAEVVSGADVELCWRAQEAGWGFETRPEAVVEHRHPETVAAMAAKARRHAAGRAWINRSRPGALSRPRVVRPLVRGLGGALVHAARGRREQALFKLTDFRWALAGWRGYLGGGNEPEVRESDASRRGPSR